MEDEALSHYAGHIAVALAKLLLLAVALPLLFTFLFGLSLPATLALIGSTLVIEYGAAPVGIGLGLHPIYVLFTLTCIAFGVTLFLFDILDTLGEHSERVAGFLKRSEERGRNSPILSKYGIYGLVPCVMTLGFYVCPPISCVFGWKRDLSILMIMTGYTGISIATILLTLGIFDLFLRP
jgi:hypothetical protein